VEQAAHLRTFFPSLIIVVIDLARDDQKQCKPSQTKKSDSVGVVGLELILI
jgi:hypothetical protein